MIHTDGLLNSIQQELDQREKEILHSHACFSGDGIRRRPEKLQGYRQNFAVDCDRILHSKSYTRYIDKTQVFSMVLNDHITHRVLHVQLVSKIGRTIGRFLRLNEDLIEAIALGHDLGHPPFGHDGETILARLCIAHGLPPFLHNLQSIRFLESLEKKGTGLNLTLQTLDGILCHDGEVNRHELRPQRQKTFVDLDQEIAQKAAAPRTELTPMTFEGCVVRLADTIAYIGRDIEDAIELGIISRHDLPPACVAVLGNTNGHIVYNLVTDLIANSRERDTVSFSAEIAEALLELKRFNYQSIYLNPKVKLGNEEIANCYEVMFDTYLQHLANQDGESRIISDFAHYLDPQRLAQNPPACIVRDFIAGMTDDYFRSQAKLLGCPIPDKQ
ncbi:MAG: HD domain-containing protein [Desulfobulbaceae bacterium]|nr:HD domain-containing protein [Desulfobulbaceae bacterium]